MSARVRALSCLVAAILLFVAQTAFAHHHPSASQCAICVNLPTGRRDSFKGQIELAGKSESVGGDGPGLVRAVQADETQSRPRRSYVRIDRTGPRPSTDAPRRTPSAKGVSLGRAPPSR